MFILRERHLMAVINAFVYGPAFLRQESRLSGSLTFFYERVGVLMPLYALSFFLAAIFLTFYKAKASHLAWAALPQFFYSFVMVDYLLQEPNASWTQAWWQFGFSLVFIVLIYSRYRSFSYGLGDH